MAELFFRCFDSTIREMLAARWDDLRTFSTALIRTLDSGRDFAKPDPRSRFGLV